MTEAEVSLSELDFREFINSQTGIIAKVCRIYANNEADFQDYFQEVTLQLWKSYHTFRGEAKRSTWVYRVALNVCLLQLRKSKREVHTQPLEGISYQVKAEDGSNESERQVKVLYEAVKQLKSTDRAIILLYLEEKSYKEIAEILGLSVSNVGVKVNRIKQQLKKLLDGKL